MKPQSRWFVYWHKNGSDKIIWASAATSQRGAWRLAVLHENGSIYGPEDYRAKREAMLALGCRSGRFTVRQVL